MHLDLPAEDVRQRPADTDFRVQAHAERVVAEYLSRWGLRDPVPIAVQSRLWVRQVLDASRDHPVLAGSANDLRRAALVQAIRAIDHWLDQLALLVAADAAEVEGRRGLLAMELPKLLEECPQVLLQAESLPAALVQQLQRAARPVVPAARRRRMPAQPLGELPPPLQPRRWRHFFGGLATDFLNILWLRRGSGS